MKVQSLLRLSGLVLLAFAVSLAALALVYAVQHPQLLAIFGTVSWNG